VLDQGADIFEESGHEEFLAARNLAMRRGPPDAADAR